MLSVLKTTERAKARELREQGWSIKAIERTLGVARSSVSRWTRDISLGAEERGALEARAAAGRGRAAERKSSAARLARLAFQEEGRSRATESDVSYAAGCMLYWAEGEKSRNRVALTKSDPALVAFFASFLRRHFAVTDEAITVYCNLFADHVENKETIEAFWLHTLGLPASSLRRSTVNAYSKYSLKKRANKLPYGTCRLVVNSTRIVQTIFGSIQEYGNFKRVEWLG